jgi:glucose-1-phosphatase
MKLLLFDLGGVLIDDSSILSLYNLTNGSLPKDQIRDKWINSNAIKLFESGLIDCNEFAQSVIVDFDLNISNDEFIKNYYNWPKGYFDGAIDLLLHLKKFYKLGFLTNSNVIHWDRIVNEFKILNYFDYGFSSHKLGYLKPDTKIFESVMQLLPYEKGDVVFFDDKLENVQSCNNYGIKSYYVNGFVELMETIKIITFDDMAKNST